MAGRFSVEAVFKALDRVSAPVSRMQNNVNKMTRSMEAGLRGVNNRMNTLGDGIKKGALYATASLGTISVAMADIINTGAEFEQTLTNAAAKFPGEIKKGTPAFKMLEDAARKTGAATEFSASQAAEALNFLAMAGFNAKSATAALPGVVDLATAAQIDLATATDIASDSLGAFNLMSKDSAQLSTNLARVNDVLAKTATSANTTVALMFETIKEAGPVATSAGASIETFAALTGELANAGLKGGRAGTVLKNMFVRLQAPTGGAAKTIKALGLQLTNQDGSMRDIIDVIGQLNKATTSMTSSQKAAALQSIFGMEAISGVNVLMAAGTDKLDAYRKQLEAAKGSSKTMAAMMRDTFSGSIKSLNSAIEGVKISIFSMNSGPLKEVVDRMTDWVRANGDLIASKLGGFLKMIIDNLGTIVTWAKRIGIALGVFIALTSVLRTFVLVMTAVNLVMAMNPIGLIVLAIVAAIAAIAALIFWWDEVKAAMVSFGQAVIDKVIGAFTWLKEMFTSLPGPVQVAIAAIAGPIGWLVGAASLVMDNWEPIKQFFVDLWGGVVNTFKSAADMITGIVDHITGMASSVVDTVSSFGAGAASFFGLGDETPKAQAQLTGQMVSPQERIARNIEEKRTSAEVTISDRTGTAQVANSTMGSSLKLQQTGGF
jgi:TP901 family phage tail tape measure protein